MLPLIAIVGPTGAGKSALAARLAAGLDPPGVEIVNCDSLQLYRGFSIGTAKIPESQRAGIPHHMVDVLDPGEVYSAGQYGRDARLTIAGISSRGRVPLVAGGTGFYLRALLDGLPQLPGRDPSLRERLAAREMRRSGSIARLLKRLDPAAAKRIHPNDTQKLTRALEVRMLTRRPAAAGGSGDALDGYLTLKIGLNPDRTALHEVLDARAHEMFRPGFSDGGGLIEEVQGLLAARCTGGEKPFESLGYRQALEHVRGSMTIEDAIASTQLETRQYAKRQWTWFRRDPEVIWLDGFGNSTEVIEKAMDLVRQRVSGGIK